MSANFDWNKIPGIHTEDSGSTANGHAASGDHSARFEQHLPIPAGNNNGHIIGGSLSKIMNTLSIGRIPEHNSMENLTTKPRSNSNLAASSSSLNLPGEDTLRSTDFKVHASSTDTIMANDDVAIILSVTKEELSAQESKTYCTWYHTLKRRKARFANRAISIDDVLGFLGNFGIPEHTKQRMKIIFGKKAESLNQNQFFALMRLIAHTMAGEPLKNSLIKIPVAIPRPIPILAKGQHKIKNTITNKIHKHSNSNEKHKLDINSFTEMLLTGQTPSASKMEDSSSKRVKFSEVVTFSPPPMTEEEYAAILEADKQADVASAAANEIKNTNSIDYSLPMDQLLEKLKQQTNVTVQQNDTPPPQQPTPASNENEEEILKDVKIDSFQKVTHLDPNTGAIPQPLKPNLTGSASKSMKEHFMHQFDQTFNFDPTPAPSSDGAGISSLAAAPSSFQPQTVTASSLSNIFGTGQPQQHQSEQQPQESADYLGQPQESYSLLTPSWDNRTSSGSHVATPPWNNMTTSETPVATNPSWVNQAESFPSSTLAWDNRPLSPPQPPVSRSKSSSVTVNSAPALPPPPPRSRKSSRANVQFSPQPTSTNINGDSNQPSLPPKPMLNSHQKERYISSMGTPQQPPLQHQQSYVNSMPQQQQQYMNVMQQQQQQYYYAQQQQQQQQQSNGSNQQWPLNNQQTQQQQWPGTQW